MLFPWLLPRFVKSTDRLRIWAGLHGRSKRSLGPAADVAERHGPDVPGSFGEICWTSGGGVNMWVIRDVISRNLDSSRVIQKSHYQWLFGQSICIVNWCYLVDYPISKPRIGGSLTWWFMDIVGLHSPICCWSRAKVFTTLLSPEASKLSNNPTLQMFKWTNNNFDMLR